MAGEVKGKIYEAITKVALEMAIKGNRKGLKVLWHEQPDWVTIEGDLTIGRDKDDVTALFLISHSTNEKLSEKKFWRNFGEIFQWKVQGKTPVSCYDILFDNAFKPELKKISDMFNDGTIVVSLKNYGKVLIDYVNKYNKKFGNSDANRYSYIEELITNSSPKFDAIIKKAITDFSGDLEKILKKTNRKTSKLWALLKTVDNRSFKAPKKVKNTYVRGGLAKLAMVPKKLRKSVYDAVKKEGYVENFPDYLFDLGFIVEDIAGDKFEDQEILSVIELLGYEECEKTLSIVNFKGMENYLLVLRSLRDFDTYFDFIINKYNQLCNKAKMKRLLLKCYDSPGSLLPATLSDVPQNVWLYLYLSSIFKAKAGKILAFGYANIASGDKTGGISKGYIKLADWLNRKKGGTISEEIIDQLANALSSNLKQISRNEVKNLKAETQSMLIQRCMYVIRTYRSYDPLRKIIEKSLTESGIGFQYVKISSVLKEHSKSKAATSQYLRVEGDNLIYWQTCLGSHVNDKTKELSARFRATKTMSDGRQFCFRPEAKRMFFIADGEWRKEDFDMFMRSGVDDIFYPDEINDLIIQIQSDKDINIDDVELPLAAEEDLALEVKGKKQYPKTQNT